MERMGHAQIQTTQKYLHTLPEADQKNLDALSRITGQQSPLTLKQRRRTLPAKLDRLVN